MVRFWIRIFFSHFAVWRGFSCRTDSIENTPVETKRSSKNRPIRKPKPWDKNLSTTFKWKGQHNNFRSLRGISKFDSHRYSLQLQISINPEEKKKCIQNLRKVASKTMLLTDEAVKSNSFNHACSVCWKASILVFYRKIWRTRECLLAPSKQKKFTYIMWSYFYNEL